MRRATVIDLEHLAKYTGGDEKLNAEIFRLFDGRKRFNPASHKQQSFRHPPYPQVV